jgi:uncharacterized protein DUF3306
MTVKSGAQRFSLSRWSRRKLAAAAKAPAATSAPAVPAPATAPGAPTPPAALELPPVESLTFDSDFTAFLQPGVDDKVKRAALKQLFRDPRFNIMDGLDTYIDDYTKADPIPPDIVADLLQRGFSSTSETGGGEAVATPPPNATLPARGAPALTDETPPAISAGNQHAATPPHPTLSPESGGEGEQAKRSSGEGDIARAGDGAVDAGRAHGQR